MGFSGALVEDPYQRSQWPANRRRLEIRDVMMMLAFLALFPVFSGFGDEEAHVSTKRTDAEVALAYALAVLKETAGKPMDGQVPLSELDVKQSVMMGEVTDANDRTYLFVAFGRRGDANSGFFVVFELCSGRFAEYSPRYAGYTSDLQAEQRKYLQLAGDATAGFGGECMW